VNFFVGAFYDGVYLLGMALNETLSEGGDIHNGTAITRRMWNRDFHGKTKTMYTIKYHLKQEVHGRSYFETYYSSYASECMKASNKYQLISRGIFVLEHHSGSSFLEGCSWNCVMEPFSRH
jgi:hypothetical protein